MNEGAPASTVRRYWTARDAQVRLDAGYVPDPEGEHAAFFAPIPVVALEPMDHLPCIALLGEPGSGKTTALAGEVARLTEKNKASDPITGDCVLHVDLRDFADLADVRRGVFQHPEVLRWKSGAYQLTLALDSLDEALIERRKLATRLATELGALPIERLRLGIACRTADWPAVLASLLPFGGWSSPRERSHGVGWES